MFHTHASAGHGRRRRKRSISSTVRRPFPIAAQCYAQHTLNPHPHRRTTVEPVLNRIEAGRLSASDLEHPDLQPLLLPLDKFDGQGSRLPGAVIKNPGGGKQKHWARCWVIDRRAKYAAASGEATAAAEYLRDPHKNILNNGARSIRHPWWSRNNHPC